MYNLLLYMLKCTIHMITMNYVMQLAKIVALVLSH